MSQNNHKIVLFLGGGGMSGVFGAGIVSALEHLNFYKHIEAVYAVSAGVLNASYFLTETARYNSSIYWENLPYGFLHPLRVPHAFVQRYTHRFIRPLPPEKRVNAVDVNFVMKVITEVKPFSISKLKNLNIPFYIRVLNVDTCKAEHLCPRDFDNPLNLIKAGISIVPYVSVVPKFNGSHYVDGSIYDPIGLDFILQQHPNSKIVVAMNIPRKRRKGNYVHNFFEGVFAHAMYKAPLFKYFMDRENAIRRGMELAEKTPNVTLITPPPESPTTVFTRDIRKLCATYEMGKDAGAGIAKLIG